MGTYHAHSVGVDELLSRDAVDAVHEPLLGGEEQLQPGTEGARRAHTGLVQLIHLTHHCTHRKHMPDDIYYTSFVSNIYINVTNIDIELYKCIYCILYALHCCDERI